MRTMVSTEGGGVGPAADGESDLLPPGAKAGPWVVGPALGHGGMGSVYGVTHDEIGKRAALKIMHQRLCGTRTAERVLLEARVVNRVGHPNIVDIFDTGTLDGRPYIVMERLDGVSLGRHAYDAKILPDCVIEILLQICDALIAAHAAGIIHRDLKLDNVFLIDNPDDPRRPRVKILDWGIAKEITSDVHHTVEGLLVGTPQYLSPEQARGGELTPATDVYSLGVMAYELFLEQLPFEAETSAEVMTMHLRATPPRPSDLWPEIPVGLEQLLFAMLAKKPDARPTMLTVAHTLELVRDELARRRGLPVPEAQRPRSSLVSMLSIESPARWRRGANRWQLAIGAAALVASTTLFVATHGNESVAKAAGTPVVNLPTLAAVPPPAPPPAPDLRADAISGPAEVTRIAVSAPTATPVIAIAHHGTPVKKPAVPKLERVRHRLASPSPAAQATPRLSAVIDPDGTIDAYR